MSMCQGNALQQFIVKSDGSRQSLGQIPGASGVNGGLGAIRSLKNSQRLDIDDAHRHGVVNNENQYMKMSEPQRVVGGGNGLHRGAQESPLSLQWLQQFQRMKVDDPMEFQGDYKQMYAQYERQHSSLTTNVRTGHAFTMGTRVPAAISYANRQQQNVQQHFENYLEQEFDALEKDLEQSSQPAVAETTVADHEQGPIDYFDEKQMSFQKAATSIYSTLSSPMHEKKFRSSKFLALMRQVSDGDVTLRKQENDTYSSMYSLVDGKTVGEEHWPVADKITLSPDDKSLSTQMGDLMDCIDDLSGLSSTEAAFRVLQ